MFRSPTDQAYLVELNEGVLRLSFNRPEFGNVIASTSVPGLTQLFLDAGACADVRCILIRGEGRMFSAGGDVAGFHRSLEQDIATRREDFGRRLPKVRKLVEAIAAFDRPIVAAVQGAVAGAGLFYPLIADVAIGEPGTFFVFAHQRIALVPDTGLSAVLPKAVGERMARTLMLTGATVKADEALRLGILTRIVAPESLEEEAAEQARRFARAPQRAIRLTKRMIAAGAHRTLAEKLDAETAGIIECVGDPDFDEGIRAFIEKRVARFPSAS